MLDMPLSQTGAVVSVALSNDEDHPASNVIDGNGQTFWMTTGLLPQTLIISFPGVVEIKELSVTGFKIKTLLVERSVRSHPHEFETFAEKTIRNEDQRIQSIDFKLSKGPVEAHHLKFIIVESYDSFVGIQHIRAELGRGAR